MALYNAQADLLKTVAVLPEILEKSKYIGNDKDKSQPNAKVHYYGVKVEMDGKILDVVSIVKEDGNGNRYYDHGIERDGGRAVQRISKTTPEMPPHEPEGSAESIIQSGEKASAKNPTGKETEPHMMTFGEFSKTAKAVKLENHGRKWEVFSGNKSLGFADDKTPDEAIRTAHKRAVNNALYSRSKHNSGVIPVAEMPPKNVLREYPDVVDKFPDVVGMARYLPA